MKKLTNNDRIADYAERKGSMSASKLKKTIIKSMKTEIKKQCHICNNHKSTRKFGKKYCKVCERYLNRA